MLNFHFQLTFKMAIIFAKILLIVCIVLIYFVSRLLVHNIYTDWNDSSDVKVEVKSNVRQNGDYWVWNNYLIADEVFIGNKSVTLATHAAYTDLGFLPNLLKR